MVSFISYGTQLSHAFSYFSSPLAEAAQAAQDVRLTFRAQVLSVSELEKSPHGNLQFYTVGVADGELQCFIRSYKLHYRKTLRVGCSYRFANVSICFIA